MNEVAQKFGYFNRCLFKRRTLFRLHRSLLFSSGASVYWTATTCLSQGFHFVKQNVILGFRKENMFADTAGLPTLCLNKVWKLREVLNVRVTTGHRPVQAQEVPAGKNVLLIFIWVHKMFFVRNRVEILEF